MLRATPHFLSISCALLVLCLQVRAAEEKLESQHPSLLSVTLTLESKRLRQSVIDALGTEIRQGVAEDKLFDGAVEYKINWSLDPSALEADIRMSGKEVLLELRTSMALQPGFTLRKGAEKIYRGSGCGKADVSLRFSVKLALEKGALVSSLQPAKVGFPRRYVCSYQRNLLGDVRNLFTRDTVEKIDVVPLMSSAIKGKVGFLADRLHSSVTALAVADSPLLQLRQLLRKPAEISPNLWLSAEVLALAIDGLKVSNGLMRVTGRLTALPRFGFGGSPPEPVYGPAAPQPVQERFHIPFDLLIPKSPQASGTVESIEINRPQYRFRAVEATNGVAALERYQSDLREDVVLLADSGPQSEGEQIPMEGPIDAVLDEIIDWLQHNSAVLTASDSRERLLREVRRAASVVAHFQRPRTLPLGAMGKMTLADLSANLQGVTLEPEQIRAGVLLTGRASLQIML